MQPIQADHRTLISIVALAIFVIPVAGCGKAAKTTPAATPTNTTTQAVSANATSEPFNAPTVKIATGTPLVHARWVAKANAICAHYYPSLNIKIKGLDELTRVLPQQAVYMHQEIQQLAKLTPPRQNRRDWQTLLNTLMQWAQGDIQLAQNPGPGPNLLKTPTGEALIATSTRAIQLAEHNHLAHCAGR
jgi:hypothetical protein